MKLIEYPNASILLQDTMSVIDENFISHYLLFESTDRIIHGKEDLYCGCSVKNNRAIEIIYLHTKGAHYFFGKTNNIDAVNLLANSLREEKLIGTILFGSTFIIDNLLKFKRLNVQKTRNRNYMSLTYSFRTNTNIPGILLVAEKKDYEILAKLRLEFYNEEFGGKGVQTNENILKEFRENLQSGDIYYNKVENQITTLISITRLPKNRIYLPYIYTNQKFRRKGITKNACEILFQKLFSSGITEIGLNVKVSNSKAIGLFNSLGMNKIYETAIYE